MLDYVLRELVDMTSSAHVSIEKTATNAGASISLLAGAFAWLAANATVIGLIGIIAGVIFGAFGVYFQCQRNKREISKERREREMNEAQERREREAAARARELHEKQLLVLTIQLQDKQNANA